MTLTDLLQTFQELGIQLRAQEGRLRVEAPAGTLTPELQEAVRDRKDELLRLLAATGSEGAPIRRREGAETEHAPLSYAQERVWLFQEFQPGAITYNFSPVVRIDGPLDPERLDRALRALLARHAVLRSRFVSSEEGVRQVVDRVPRTVLAVDDLTASSGLNGNQPDDPDEAARAAVRRERELSFDLKREIPFSARLVRRTPTRADLVLRMHHVAVDGGSVPILLRELAALYEGRELPALPVSFGDFAAWERDRWSEERTRASSRFWTGYLEGAPTELDLPTDRRRSPSPTFAGGHVHARVDGPAREALGSLVRTEKTTVFTALLAAFGSALHRESGQRDLVIGVPTEGRERPELGGLVGMFVNQLPLRVRVPRGASFRELLRQARDGSRPAFAVEEIPFPLLLETLGIPSRFDRSPLFQVMLNVLPGDNLTDLSLPAGPVTFSVPPSQEFRSDDEAQAKFDLTLYGQEGASGIGLDLVYDRDLFTRERMRRLVDRVARLLVQGTGAPDRPVETLWEGGPAADMAGSAGIAGVDPGSGEGEVAGGETRAEAERMEETVPGYLEAWGRDDPDRIALAGPGERIVFAELCTRMARVASAVASRTAPGARVAVMVPHGIDAAVALCGVLASGRPYVPVDPALPEERIRFMLQDAEVGLILTTEPCDGIGVAVLDLVEAERERGGETVPPPDPDAVAYLLYTSGSTGRPKAVVQTHRNLARQARRYQSLLQLGPDDRVALTATISSDASLMDLFGGLLAGAAVVPVDLQGDRITDVVTDLMDLGVTTLHFTPTLFRAFLGATESRLPAVRAVVLGGEHVRPEDVGAFDDRFDPDAVMVNLYGSSEHSFALAHRVDRAVDRDAAEVPIGRPVGDVEVVLLDEEGEPDPVRGVLAVRSGAGAIGYWNRPELEGAVWPPDPERPGSTLYRSGDLARRRTDGRYVLLGRSDRQVKVRGFRVELEEVEAVLEGLEEVRECVVEVYDDPTAGGRLAAWVAYHPGRELMGSELRGWLRERLPDYMVPSLVKEIEAVPLTPTGKVDRRSLPDPMVVPDRDFMEPATPFERALAEIWCDTLGLPQVGLRDNFFELGGTSLLAMRTLARMEERTGCPFEPRDMITGTLEQLAGVAERRAEPESGATVP